MGLLKKIIENQNFNPGIIGILFNPFFIARKGLAKNIKILSPNITGKILDVGCGTKPYQSFFNCSQYVGLEFDTGIDSEKKTADYYYDGKVFPFASESFDCVICNQVLEHVFEPENFLSEIFRVLKPEGILLLTVPFIWDEHEQPFDFARYSSFGIKYLLERNSFRIISHHKSVNNVSAVFQLLSAYIYKLTYRIKVLKWLFIFLFIFPINLIGFLCGMILPSNNDFYLDNIVLAKKI